MCFSGLEGYSAPTRRSSVVQKNPFISKFPSKGMTVITGGGLSDHFVSFNIIVVVVVVEPRRSVGTDTDRSTGHA